MENKKASLDTLWSWASQGVQEDRKKFINDRGVGSNRAGTDKTIIKGKSISIESYRLDKFLKRTYFDDNGCVCLNGVSSNGYKNIYLHGRSIGAHCFSYMFYVGDIPKGLVIDHICRNRSCINPHHLRCVTHRVNILAGSGATAKHAVKTHCSRGHEFTEANTYKSRHGRGCRTCRTVKRREYYLKHAERDKQIRRDCYLIKQMTIVPKGV